MQPTHCHLIFSLNPHLKAHFTDEATEAQRSKIAYPNICWDWSHQPRCEQPWKILLFTFSRWGSEPSKGCFEWGCPSASRAFHSAAAHHFLSVRHLLEELCDHASRSLKACISFNPMILFLGTFPKDIIVRWEPRDVHTRQHNAPEGGYICTYVCMCVCIYIYKTHTYIHSQLICIVERQKPTRLCKAVIIQLKKHDGKVEVQALESERVGLESLLCCLETWCPPAL